MRSSTGRAAAAVAVALAIGCAAAALAQTPPPSGVEAPQAARDRKLALDALFAALHRAGGDEEADAITAEIWRTWTQSGRQDVDLLMGRAASAMASRNLGLASLLLDEVIELAPDFAEGWNRRATLLFLMGEHDRSLADIDKVLALEPRHFGALAGRGMIHMSAGRLKEALAAWRAALAVHPFLHERHGIIRELEKKVEGNRL
jgi:tetratricopeptide (TPR) repeat protein